MDQCAGSGPHSPGRSAERSGDSGSWGALLTEKLASWAARLALLPLGCGWPPCSVLWARLSDDFLGPCAFFLCAADSGTVFIRTISKVPAP